MDSLARDLDRAHLRRLSAGCKRDRVSQGGRVSTDERESNDVPTQEKTRLPSAECYAGIDVGKRLLDFYIHPSGAKLQVDNDRSGILKLIRL